jgi:hypothetical protein
MVLMEAVRLEKATSSVSSVSFSSVSNLNLFLLRRSEPFSNIAMALGWSVQ